MSKKNKENIEETKDLENQDSNNQDDQNNTDLGNQDLENQDSNNQDDEPESYKLEILVKFTDKYTGEKYKVGDVIEVNKERYLELINDTRALVKDGE